MVTNHRNIDAKKPPASLFKPLTGYTKVDNMMALMGMEIGALGIQDKSEALPRKDARDASLEKIMAGMKQLMGGENANPEQMSPLREAFSQAMEVKGQTKTYAGSVGGIWQVIPRRPGDQMGNELKTSNVHAAALGTASTLTEVCDFDESRLGAKGWKTREGMFRMNRGFYSWSRESSG